MPICKCCTRCVRHPKAHSWKKGLCPSCASLNGPEKVDQRRIITPDFIKKKTSPIDAYLDWGTLYELGKMN